MPPLQAPSESDRPLGGLCVAVTGSSSGIGRAILEELTRAGAAVVSHANRSHAEAALAAEKIRAGGGRAWALRADLADPGQCARLVEEAFEVTGGKLNAWVNNAGVDILTGTGAHAAFETKLEALYRVDVCATMLLTRAVGARLRNAGGGSIVNLGWDQAETGMEGDSAELFAATKGAVMCFTRSAALSLAPHVRVNCVAPGWIRTAWGEGASNAWQERVLRETPLCRWGTPGDVARVVKFLVSPEASYLTGQVVRVNGGAVR